jgi:hypothetical protein
MPVHFRYCNSSRASRNASVFTLTSYLFNVRTFSNRTRGILALCICIELEVPLNSLSCSRQTDVLKLERRDTFGPALNRPQALERRDPFGNIKPSSPTHSYLLFALQNRPLSVQLNQFCFFETQQRLTSEYFPLPCIAEQGESDS